MSRDADAGIHVSQEDTAVSIIDRCRPSTSSLQLLCVQI